MRTLATCLKQLFFVTGFKVYLFDLCSKMNLSLSMLLCSFSCPTCTVRVSYATYVLGPGHGNSNLLLVRI